MKEILYFTSDWCYPCKDVEKTLFSFLDKHPEIMYTRIDADENVQKVLHYEIKSVPCVFALKDGFVYNNICGKVSEEDLENLIK